MLNRRFLRVKVLQALYAYKQSSEVDIPRGEKEMMKSIEKVYDLYLYLLSLIIEVAEASRRDIESRREKHLPSEEDLKPNLKFINSPALAKLENNIAFKRLLENHKINWQEEQDNIRKLFKTIEESDTYKNYLSNANSSFEADRDFLVKIFKQFIGQYELAHQFLEEKNIYWEDDLVLASLSTIKTLSSLTEDMDERSVVLLELYKDKKDDQEFVKTLYRKTILHGDDYSEMIAQKAKNWEMERIAVIDVLFMKMALCEFEHLSSIPVKVSLNEYIELSKSYSTPKSKVFINGILDKLVPELKESGRIKKRGRGLIE